MQIRATIPDQTASSKKKATWLDTKIESLQKLEGTLRTWQNIGNQVKNLALSFGAYVLTVLGLNSLNSVFDLIPRLMAFLPGVTSKQMPSLILNSIIVISFLFYFYIFFYQAFLEKREIFLKGRNGGSIYELENDLFQLLDREKNSEFALDMMFYLVVSGLFLILGLLSKSLCLTPIFFILIILIVIEAFRRENSQLR